MMLNGQLANKAWLKYADEVRRDRTNLYYCTRLLERGYLPEGVTDAAQLVRQAALTVYKFDPLAYITTFPHASDLLSDIELEELTTALTIEGDEDATNFLRGKLWSDAAQCKKIPEPFARRAYEYLSRVSEAAARGEPEYIQALATCARLIDYETYKGMVRRLLDSREPEWRGHELIKVLETAVQHRDWATYLTWRAEWDQLPPNAHLCECYFNNLYTFDGLRNLERRAVASIPQLLLKAVDVRGCPHLNSGSANMMLIERLIERRILLTESLAYLEACSNFCSDDERIAPLREKIEAVLHKNA